jgi:hypothetical protein
MPDPERAGPTDEGAFGYAGIGRMVRIAPPAARGSPSPVERSAAERGILIVPREGIALYREDEDPSPDDSG